MFLFNSELDNSFCKARNIRGYETTIGISLDLFWVYEYPLPDNLPFSKSHHIERMSNDEYLCLRECKEPLLLGDVWNELIHALSRFADFYKQLSLIHI